MDFRFRGNDVIFEGTTQPFALCGSVVYVIGKCQVRKGKYGLGLRGGAFREASAGWPMVVEGHPEGRTCGIRFCAWFGY